MKKKCGGTSEEDLKNIEKDYGMLPKHVSSNESIDLNDEDLDMLPDYKSSSKKSSNNKKYFPRPKLTEAQIDARNKRKEKLDARNKRKETLNKNKIRYQSRKKIADKRPRIKGRFVKTDEKIKEGGMGPTSDDRKYMMDQRKIYMADLVNPGMPMSLAPGMRKKASKSSNRKLPKKKSPPKKKLPKKKSPPKLPTMSQRMPQRISLSELTPAERKVELKRRRNATNRRLGLELKARKYSRRL